MYFIFHDDDQAVILQGLSDAFASLPASAQISVGTINHAAVHGPDTGFDAELAMTVAKTNVLLLIQVKTSLFPRDAREVAWRLQLAGSRRMVHPKQHLVLFVAAQSISEGARQVLSDEGIGYYDVGGSLSLPLPSTYILIDRPPAKAERKTIGSIFSGKRAAIVHAILTTDADDFGVNQVAEMAKVSPATASETLSELERIEWVGSRGNGPAKMRYLIDRTGLLDAWRKDIESKVRRIERRRYYVPGAKAADLATKLALVCEKHSVDYAVTGEAAAHEYAPHLSNISRLACRFDAGAPLQSILDAVDARPVSEGANLELIETRTGGELVGRRQINGIWYASPVQVYLDLISGEGRARDAAEHLRGEILGY